MTATVTDLFCGAGGSALAAEPPDTTLAVRVAPLPPCPACNDDGVLSTLDGDTIGPCPECAP